MDHKPGDNGVYVPGTFSQTGRSTQSEIDGLKQQLNLEDPCEGEKDAAKSSKTLKHSKSTVSGKGHEDIKPKTPGGELAKAIQAKLQTSQAEDGTRSKQAVHSPVEDKSERKTACFGSEGKEGNWASKFTATYDIGSINHRGEQHPPPVWYRVKHDSVINRPPVWDVTEHPKQVPRSKPEEDPSSLPLAFMTGLDLDDKEAIEGLTARQRGMLKDALGQPRLEKPKPLDGSMSLNTKRGPLGKIGRNHVLAHEVSCAGDSDLLDQDIKGYPKLRFPEWDFEANSARKPLIPTDAMGEPGKYDYSLDCVKAVPKNGIGFGKALPRSTCVSLMGYSAPIAALHPEEKRTRGLLPDRSRGKDASCSRHRIVLVNDFDTELPRPPLLTGAAQMFHDENNPEHDKLVHQRQMTYDASTSNIPVTSRRDIAPSYARMIGRGRDAVQGLRALSSDLAVRGSVGLGFVETTSMSKHSVVQVEARAARGGRENPDVGPNFDNRTVNVHNSTTEKMMRGRALVSGGGFDKKYSPLNRPEHPILTNAFKRSPSLPGFQSRSKFGGTRILARDRSYSAYDSGWSLAELDGEAP